MIETAFPSKKECSVAHLSRHKNLRCCCLQQGLWSTADRSRAVLSRTLILNSAELGCITTRATDTALPQNQPSCLSHCCSSPFFPSLLSCLGVHVVAFMSIMTNVSTTLMCRGGLCFISMNNIYPTWSRIMRWTSQLPPPSSSQNKASTPMGLSFLQSGTVENGLTHRVINSFPM